MVENGKSAEATVPDSRLLEKIRAAFQAFDTESDNTVDIKEIGSIFYLLGCFPTLMDLLKFTAEVEEEHSGNIHWDRFLPAMSEVLLERKEHMNEYHDYEFFDKYDIWFPPISEERLLEAFEVLDKEKKGYLEPEELTNYMTNEGEPFTQEEMDEMLIALADKEKNLIYYKDIITQLTLEPKL